MIPRKDTAKSKIYKPKIVKKLLSKELCKRLFDKLLIR